MAILIIIVASVSRREVQHFHWVGGRVCDFSRQYEFEESDQFYVQFQSLLSVYDSAPNRCNNSCSMLVFLISQVRRA
jgi:hypothetical protein